MDNKEIEANAHLNMQIVIGLMCNFLWSEKGHDRYEKPCWLIPHDDKQGGYNAFLAEDFRFDKNWGWYKVAKNYMPDNPHLIFNHYSFTDKRISVTYQLTAKGHTSPKKSIKLKLSAFKNNMEMSFHYLQLIAKDYITYLMSHE